MTTITIFGLCTKRRKDLLFQPRAHHAWTIYTRRARTIDARPRGSLINLCEVQSERGQLNRLYTTPVHRRSHTFREQKSNSRHFREMKLCIIHYRIRYIIYVRWNWQSTATEFGTMHIHTFVYYGLLSIEFNWMW